MSSLFDLSGRVAVVTGASSGIGASAAIAYAHAGADVALIARDSEKLKIISKEIEKIGRRALLVPLDVSKELEVKNGIINIMENFSKIDILLNDAGIAISGDVENLSEQSWDKGMSVNVKGPFLMSKYVVPHMRKVKYGKIINISSVNSFLGDKQSIYWRHNYNSTKASLRGLTIGMAASYAQENITVNSIGPGLFKTGMTEENLFKDQVFLDRYNYLTPAARPGKPGELDGTIIYLSSDASSYVTGQFIAVDGGFSIV